VKEQNRTYLSDPSSLNPHSKEGVLQVVIETPKNSRNKYAFDSDRRVLALRKVLPAGMMFPYDFGFVPSTQAEDGDPIDALVLMDAPALPGCVLEVRVIGVIRGEDELDEGKTRRNDRLITLAEVSHTFEDVRKLDDLPEQLVKEMQEFFASYPRISSGSNYKLLEIGGADEAHTLIKQSADRALNQN